MYIVIASDKSYFYLTFIMPSTEPDMIFCDVASMPSISQE